MRFVDGDVAEKLVGKAGGELAIVLFAQGDGFLAGDLAVADLLRGVVGAAADAVLDVGGVVEKVVDFVVDGVVFRVGARRALGAGHKAAVLDRVVVRPLRVPALVVA